MKIPFIKRLSYSISLLIFVIIYTVSAVIFSLFSFISLEDGKLSFTKGLGVFKELFDRSNDTFFDACFSGGDLSALTSADSPASSETGYTVILDPGHGGPDPGANGITGEAEKHLNLSLSMKTAEFLKLYGINVILTRDSDIWLADENASHKKHSDVTNRVRFCKEHENDAFVSIHMNSFPQESCKGAQVFYSSSEESRRLAEIISGNITSRLQTDNKRQIKEAGSSIFILDRTDTCSVLIECGFVSNYDEAVLLNDDKYQNKLAFIIAGAINEYLNTKQ